MDWQGKLVGRGGFAWHFIRNGIILTLAISVMMPPCINSTNYYDPSLGLHGACLRRCELHRSGWTEKFSFDCNALFDNETTRAECVNDCKFCPKSVCDPSQGAKFECPTVTLDDPADSTEKSKPGTGTLLPHVVLAVVIPIIMIIAILVAVIFAYWLHLKRVQARKVQGTTSTPTQMEAQTKKEGDEKPSSASGADAFDDTEVHSQIFGTN